MAKPKGLDRWVDALNAFGPRFHCSGLTTDRPEFKLQHGLCCHESGRSVDQWCQQCIGLAAIASEAAREGCVR